MPRANLPKFNVTLIITILTYLFLLGALISTIILFTACMPFSDGQPSMLSNVYAVQLALPGPEQRSIRIASFAICTDTKGIVACAKTYGKTAGTLVSLLYGPHTSSLDDKAMQAALNLQRKVFFGISVPACILLLASLILAPAFLLVKSTRSKLVAVGLALASAALLLVDGFSTRLVLSALEIASREETRGKVYGLGRWWMVLQWMGFAMALLAGLGLGTGGARKPASEVV
jgi:hypothetical protein